jgi:hypothetical protein
MPNSVFLTVKVSLVTAACHSNNLYLTGTHTTKRNISYCPKTVTESGNFSPKYFSSGKAPLDRDAKSAGFSRFITRWKVHFQFMFCKKWKSTVSVDIPE